MSRCRERTMKNKGKKVRDLLLAPHVCISPTWEAVCQHGTAQVEVPRLLLGQMVLALLSSIKSP